jgi:hypothetical protein
MVRKPVHKTKICSTFRNYKVIPFTKQRLLEVEGLKLKFRAFPWDEWLTSFMKGLDFHFKMARYKEVKIWKLGICYLRDKRQRGSGEVKIWKLGICHLRDKRQRGSGGWGVRMCLGLGLEAIYSCFFF